MEAVKKYWFWGIFISILSIFAMSHNANAIELTLDFSDYSLSRQLLRPTFDMTFNNDSTTFYNTFQIMPVNSADFVKVQKYKSHSSFNLKAGDLVIMRTLIGSQTANGPYADSMAYIQRNFTTNNANLLYIGSKTIDASSDYTIISSLGYGPNANEFYTQLTDYYHSLKIYEFYFRSQIDQSDFIGFESTNYNNNSGMLWVYPSYSSPASLVFTTLSIEQYHYNGNSANKEQEEKTQEAVNESEAAGGNSSTDAQTGTTGLLNAITGAVNVIAAARPTNCKINGNMGNLDIGQLDLCANPAPAFVQTIGSLILILICVPLAISLFNRFIAIFRSFQS